MEIPIIAGVVSGLLWLCMFYLAEVLWRRAKRDRSWIRPRIRIFDLRRRGWPWGPAPKLPPEAYREGATVFFHRVLDEHQEQYGRWPKVFRTDHETRRDLLREYLVDRRMSLNDTRHFCFDGIPVEVG